MGKKKSKKQGKKTNWKAVSAFASSMGQFGIKLVPVAAVLSIAFLMVFGAKQFLYADSGLNIQKVHVEPAQALSIPQLQNLEMKYLGRNILQVDIQSIADALEKDPAIRSAKVYRKLPNQLSVELVPRTPIGFIRFSPKGGFGAISEDGMILSVTNTPNPSSVVIEAFESGLKEPSLGSTFKSKGFLEAAKFLSNFAEHSLAQEEKVTKITLSSTGNVIIVLRMGPPIHLGHRPSERLDALQEMLPLLNREDRMKIDYVDLQFDNVIVKRKG